MTYEEKRELRLQISQLLADANINQSTLREMVREEIANKTDRAIQQVAYPIVRDIASNTIRSSSTSMMYNAIKEELKNRIIKVTLSDDVEIDK